MGLFQHFPYTNFHDLNLDVILKRTEEAEASAASSASDAAQAAANAQSAVTTANQALTQANAAQTTANNALTTANEALAAANKTVITVNCDATNNTAELVSDLTFEQIIEAAQQNNILLRLSLSTDSDNVYRQLVYPTLQYFSVQDYWSITADLIRSDGTATVAPSRIYIDKAIFIDSKNGYYQHAQILASTIA